MYKIVILLMIIHALFKRSISLYTLITIAYLRVFTYVHFYFDTGFLSPFFCYISYKTIVTFPFLSVCFVTLNKTSVSHWALVSDTRSVIHKQSVNILYTCKRLRK